MLVLDDLVRGRVEFDWASEQDHVIQRADGSCLYHLATVVDDHDMQISHVIRAEEHLSNTPRQVFIVQQLGYELPTFAHLPYVAEPGSKNKLSKRKLDKYLKNRDFAALIEHGQSIARRLGLAVAAETFNPVIVDFYEQVGFLPGRDSQLPAAVGLVARRQDGGVHARGNARALLARAGEQGPGQFRSGETVGVPGPGDAAVAAEAESGADGAVSAAGRAGRVAAAMRHGAAT